MKTYLIAVENLQELFDLSLIIKEIKSRDKNSKFVLFDTSNIFKIEKENITEYINLFDVIVESINVNDKVFSSLSIFKKIYSIIINVKLILKTIKIHNITIFLSGVPLSFFRLTRILNNKILYIGYIRGIIANDDDSSSSANLYKKIKFITNKSSILYCDYLAMVSNINIQYFYNNGVNNKNLIKTGPIHLDYLKSKKIENKENDKITLIFATSAFSHHHIGNLEKEQLLFLKKLLKLHDDKYKDKFDVRIRIHPRDNKENYKGLIKKYNIQLEDSSIEKFLTTATKNKILISAVSTLNFEWEFLGGTSLFYTGVDIYSTHENFYKSIGVDPIYDVEELFKDNINKYKSLSGEEFYKHKEGNINYFVNFIESINI